MKRTPLNHALLSVCRWFNDARHYRRRGNRVAMHTCIDLARQWCRWCRRDLAALIASH